MQIPRTRAAIAAIAVSLMLMQQTGIAETASGATPLTAAEITALLSGNTAVGAWSGTPYRQIFTASGQTTYAAENAPLDYGRWRVNVGTDKYESEWSRPGAWSAYGISRKDALYYWVEGDGDMQSFTIEPGLALKKK